MRTVLPVRFLIALAAAAACFSTSTAHAQPLGGGLTPPSGCPEAQESDRYGNCFDVGPSGSASAVLMYLRMLGEDGITVKSPDGAVNDAHSICGLINSGTDPASLVLTVVKNSGMVQQRAADAIVESIVYFCPDVDDNYFKQIQHFGH